MAFSSLIGVWRDGPLADSVPENTAVSIDVPRGADVDVEVLLVDSNGDPVDLDVAGADRLELSVRQAAAPSSVLKSWLATKVGSALGRYSFSILSADTLDFAGRLVFDVWATRSSAQRQVVAPSYFNSTPRERAP